MSVIDDIKARVDIAEVVGQYVQLQKSGRNFRGLCPFHQERTPSFHVSPERGTWHCFGACATGGDVIEFVKRRENVEFPEALRILAQRAGITIPDRRAPQEDERFERLYKANEAAAAFYHSALRTSQQASLARDYLKSRGLDNEVTEAFELGYSPDEWEALKSHLLGRGFTEKELTDAGLIREGDRGTYDQFRARIMFPIRDDRGRVTGFGARALEGTSSESSPAKYLNSARTPTFDKSRLLYGLDRAKESVRSEGAVIVVEGYMDAIAAHQHGVTNVVASMGTALTEAQIRLLERFRAKILLALDADAAGIQATLRALQEAEHAGVIRASSESAHPEAVDDEAFAEKVAEWSRNALKRAAINFFVVPLSGKDPDEMIRADRAAWDAAVADARPFTDHVFDVVGGRIDRTQPAQRAQLLQELLPVVRLIEEPTHRAHYVQRLARLAQVREGDVHAELRRRPSRPTQESISPAQPAVRVTGAPGEAFLLALLLRHHELRGEGMTLSGDLFLLSEHRMIYEAWRTNASVDEIRAALPDELHAQLDHVLATELPVLDGGDLRRALEGCVAKIEKDRVRQAKLASAAALSEPERQGEMVAAIERAHALQDARISQDAGGPGGRDTAAAQLAATLVEDAEMGRRLHQISQRVPDSDPDTSPHPEGAS